MPERKPTFNTLGIAFITLSLVVLGYLIGKIESFPQEPVTSEISANYPLEDLEAQQSMAVSTRWMLWVTAFGIVLLYLTLRETQQATHTARKAVQAQVDSERPLLQVAGLKLFPAPDSTPSDFRFYLSLRLKNYGKSSCWLQSISVTPFIDRELPDDAAYQGETVLSAFVAPGDCIDAHSGVQRDDNEADGISGKIQPIILSHDEVLKLQRKAIIPGPKIYRMFVFGYSIYNGLSNSTWRSHFAFEIEFDESFQTTSRLPVSSLKHWQDAIVARP